MDEKQHCERFNDLPEPTKEFLEQLSSEDIASIKEGIKLARATKTVGKFWKWTMITTLAVFTGAAAFGQSVKWLWNAFRGGAG